MLKKSSVRMMVVNLESSLLRMIFWIMILSTLASALPTYDQEDPFEMTVGDQVLEDDGPSLMVSIHCETVTLCQELTNNRQCTMG